MGRGGKYAWMRRIEPITRRVREVKVIASRVVSHVVGWSCQSVSWRWNYSKRASVSRRILKVLYIT